MSTPNGSRGGNGAFAKSRPPALPDLDPPFLDPEPPPWAARGLATLLISLFGVALLGAVIVRVPETVAARFVLVPVKGADPVRALRPGQVSEVRTNEGAAVVDGATLFVLRSSTFGDRAVELDALRGQIAGAAQAERNARTEHEARRAADAQAAGELRTRLASLGRALEIRKEQQRLAADAVARYRAGIERGSVSTDELTTRQLEAGRLAQELEAAGAEREATIASIARLRHEGDAREAAWREQERALAQTLAQARIRAAALEREMGVTTGGVASDLAVTAPCAGTVLRLSVRSAGAVVREGETLAEVACSRRQLLAELTVPPAGVARMREGQRVKLLYDAFPFQRYGTRAGTVRWVSPAVVGSAESSSTASEFRALVDVRDTSVRVDGAPRALLAGMGGQARVVVGRRTLVSYAFDPIRQLRESLADAEGQP